MYNQAKYDNESVTLGQLKNVEEKIPDPTKYSKNFGVTPSPPYSVGDTWASDGKIYKCIKERLYGSFSMSDWELVATDDSNFNEFVENVYTAYELSIPNQSDGKIESFVQDEAPSSNWDTDVLKEIHRGDLWYSKEASVQKRFIKKTVTPVSYDWELVSVPMNLFNLISGHKNIFVNKPNKYEADDYWIIDTEEDIPENCELGEIVVATNPSDVYNKNDFEKRDIKTIKVNAIEDEYYNKEEIDIKTSDMEKNTESKINQAKDEVSLEVKSEIKVQIIKIEQTGDFLELIDTPASNGAIKKLSIKGFNIRDSNFNNHYYLDFSNIDSFSLYEELEIESPITLKTINKNEEVISDEILIEDSLLSIIQRISDDGETILDEPIIHEIKAVLLPTYDDKTYIRTRDISINQNFSCEYIKKNELTNMYTTTLETRAMAQLTEQNLKLKVSKGDVIAEINLSPDDAKILAKKIIMEGLVTANDYFKILLDGSMEARNGKFYGNVYLPDGGEVIGGNGILTNLQYETGSDFDELGFQYYYTVNNFVPVTQELSVYIPKNFTIKEATITLFHMPQRVNSSSKTAWGYARNIKLYKNDLMNILWDLYVAGESYSYDRGNLSEIKGAFGENGYTPPEPTDNDYKTQIVISKDIKSELSSGMNNFVLKSDYTISESIPDEPGAEDFISYKYSGRVIAFLNIIGNLATKENS